MSTNLGDILKSESLLDVSWDGSKLRDVFIQTIKIFNTHEKQILDMQNQIPNFVQKELFNKLNDEVDDIATTQNAQKKELEKLIDKKFGELMNEIEHTKDLINVTTNDALTESKRMIDAQIQEVKGEIDQINGECRNNAGKNSSLETEINLLKQKIEKGFLDAMQANQNLSQQQLAQQQLLLARTQKAPPPENANTADPSFYEQLGVIEARLKSLEDQMKQFTDVENQVTEISIVTGVLDKKVAKLTDNFTDLATKGVVNTKALAIMHEPEPKEEKPPPPPEPPKQEPPQIELQEIPTLEELPDLAELLPSHSKENFNDTGSSQTTERIIATHVARALSNSGSKSELNSQTEIVTDDLDRHILQVIENKVYTTQMQSSMRVVTEIEAIKKAIGKHHDAIKQIQHQQNVIKENTNSLAENISTTNAAHLTRFSQMAQQRLTDKQEIEEMRKAFVDQITNVKRRITFLAQSIQQLEEMDREPTVVEVQAPAQPMLKEMHVEEEEEKAEEPPQTSLNILQPLPPLQPEIKFDEQEEEEQKPETPKKALPPPRTHYKQTAAFRQLVDLQFAHFVEDLPPVPEYNPGVRHVMTPGAMQSTKSLPYDEYSEESAEQTERRSVHQSHRKLKNEEEETLVAKTSLPSFDGTAVQQSQRPPIAERIIIKYGIPSNFRRPSTSHAQDHAPMPLITDEQIETKVSRYAASAVATLEERIHRRVDEKLAQMQTNNDQVISMLDRKIDREFVERMFDKFREMMNAFKEEIDNMQASFLNWVTRDELEIVLRQFNDMIHDTENTAVSTSKYHCLLCGRPRQRVAGMINGQSLSKSKQIGPANATRKSSMKPTKMNDNTDKISVMSV